MSLPTFQTVALRRGRHEAPTDGACVMELTSMLAEEAFSDRPRSVCPAIIPFMWGYNDTLHDTRRQDLRRLALTVLGSRGPEPDVEAWADFRAEMSVDWARHLYRRHRRLRMPGGPLALRFAHSRERLCELAGAYCGLIARADDEAHAHTMRFVERLAALTQDQPQDDVACSTAASSASERRCVMA